MKLSSDNTFNCAAAGKLTWFPMPTALNRTISPLRNVIWPWAVPVITSSTAGFHAYLSVPANLATIPAIRPVPLHSPSKSTSATNPFSPTSVILRVMVLVWSSQSIAPRSTDEATLPDGCPNVAILSQSRRAQNCYLAMAAMRPDPPRRQVAHAADFALPHPIRSVPISISGCSDLWYYGAGAWRRAMLQDLCSFCFLLLTTDACAFPNLLRRVADHDADINRKRTFGGGGQLYCNFN